MATNASFAEAAAVAWQSLRASKLRSFLTLLGIILATTTLIAVMSVINGMNKYIAQQVSDMGVDGFRVRRFIFIGNFDPKKFLEMQRRNPEMSKDEFEFLKGHAKLVREIGMEAFQNVTAKYQGKSIDWLNLTGVSPNMGVISAVQAVTGRFFSETDNSRRLSVVFIGNDVKDEFFPTTNPIGKIIELNNRPFEIIGVAKAQGTVFGESRDNFVMIPIDSYAKMFSARKGLGYNALAIDAAHLNEAEDEIRSLLRAYRHTPPNQEDTFGMAASDSLVGAWQNLTGAIAGTAVAIVSVFMVVGGVVIMNIMLAVVTERTREIGVRKSVGARRRDILNQFLVESSMLAACGGLIGVATAWMFAILIRNLTPVPMQVPLSAVIVGVGLSALVGLFFGIYPAQRAAKLDPIEALRFE